MRTVHLPATPFEVPIIDIGAFASGSIDDRRAVAAAVDRAATGVGFMQIVGHEIPDTAIDGLTDAMDAFFAQDVDVKMRYRPSSVATNRGYSGPLSERLSYSVGVASAADLFEAFNVGTPASRYPHLALATDQYAENIWPNPDFRTKLERGSTTRGHSRDA